MTIIKTTEMKMKEFFNNGVYVIPTYQRGYAWEKSQLENFWDDLEYQRLRNLSFEHYLGQIVIHQSPNDNVEYIIDGQQRITTVIIFMSVIRAYYHNIIKQLENETDNNDFREDIDDVRNSILDIDSTYIGQITKRSNTIKLELGIAGNDFFKKYVQKNCSLKPISSKDIQNPTEKNIRDAIHYFRKEIDDRVKLLDINEQISLLDQWMDTIHNNFQISYIKTDDQTQAYTIFETLNARGRSLATSDLLKNHIIRTTNDETRANIIRKWETMTDDLEMIDPTKYIRSFWNSEKFFIRDRSLYNNMRKEYSESGQIEELMQYLTDNVSIFKSMNDPKLNPYPVKSINKKLKDLKSLSVSTFYPIVLSVANHEHYYDDDLELILDAIVTYYVRNIVVGGGSPNTTETFLSTLAVKISQTPENITKNIYSSIQQKTISDKEFVESFKNFESKNTSQTRYLLSEIEKHLSGNEKIIDEDIIHVEHIMPKSRTLWNIDEEKHEQYVNRFGNQTLLGAEYNQEASNKIFQEKKLQYSKSKVKLTDALLQYDSWTTANIKKRQDELSKYALLIWKGGKQNDV